MFSLLPQLGAGFGAAVFEGTGGDEIPAEVIESLTAFGKAKVNLRNLIAESTVFQAAVGATGSSAYKIAAAKARIHLTAYEGKGTYSRPFAVIMRNTNDNNNPAGDGNWVYGGDLELKFEADIPEEYKDDPDNAELYFENFYESVMAECLVRGQMPGYFTINKFSVIEGPIQCEEAAGEFIYAVRLNINWGLESS